MKLSCTSIMVPGNSLTEKARNLKKWGYDGIGVFIDYAEWNEELRAEVLKLEENTGVHPCEFIFSGDDYGHLMSEDSALAEATFRMYSDAAAMCAVLGGAISELEYTLGAQDPLPLFDLYAKIPSGRIETFIERYASIAKQVEGSPDSYVLLEPCNRYETPYLNNMDDCASVVKMMEMKNIGILVDTFHLNFEEKDLSAKIREAGDLVKYVHLGDSNRLLPGYGHIDWKQLFKALKDIGFDGYCSLECSCGGGDATQLLPETAEYLKRLL